MCLFRWIPVAVLVSVLAASFPVRAQDVQYWDNTYGTRSTLLSGAVIGSATDLSATFYNPGALALFQEPAFILGARAWDFSSIQVRNSAGRGADLNTSISGPAADLVAGLFPVHFVSGDQLAYSFLTRQGSNLRVQMRTEATADVTPAHPGDETFVGEVTLEQNLYESWTGLTWSVPAGKNVGVGVTQYVAYRSQRGRLQTLGQAFALDGQVASATELKEFDFTDWRTVTKAGLQVRLASLTLGLNLTSPGLHLQGGGTVAVDTAITGFDLDGDGVANPVFIADQQRDVKAHYRSPLSVGLGAGCRAGSTGLHASAEWFDRLARYRVLDTAPFTSQSSRVRTESPIVDEAKSVLDLGVGLTQRFGEHLSGFGGFSLDRTPRVPGTALSVGAWDIYHVSSGAEFRLGRTDLILGVVYSFGREDVGQLADPGAGSGRGLGPGPSPDAEVRFNSLRVVFGFSYGAARQEPDRQPGASAAP